MVEKVIWEVAGEDGDQDMMAIKEKEEKRKKEEKKLDWLWNLSKDSKHVWIFRFFYYKTCLIDWYII